MTEQEKRIEEMVRTVGEVFRSTIHGNYVGIVCSILEEAGYRKEDEVEKQTIKRVIRELSGHVFKRKTDNGFDIYVVCEEDLKFIESLF